MPWFASQSMNWHVMLFNLLLVSSCGYALWRGGPPERIVGGSLLAAAIATFLAYSPLPDRFRAMEIGLLLVDLVLLAILSGVAICADRAWPLFLAGLQLDTVGAHLVKAIDANVINVTYAVMIAAWSYPMVLLLAIGTWRYRRRLTRQGYDLAWCPRNAARADAAS